MRIYFTSDLHGSEKAWLKFLNAPKYYQADVIMIGGDITGKFIVPIVFHHDGMVATTFMGHRRKLRGSDEVEELKKQIGFVGQYGVEMTEEEHSRYNETPSLLVQLFERVMLERVERWVKMADERFKDRKVRVFVSAGNDDSFEVDDILRASQIVENHDGKVLQLEGGFELMGLGYSNITPWNCPRDISDEELAERIDHLAGQIRNMKQAILAIHVPPYDTRIDYAPKLTDDMRVVMTATGEPEMIPVGSPAVREAILRYSPMLGLHGHIHESAGIVTLGETRIVNPGSEYAEGILRGALIDLDEKVGLVNIQLVSG
jgi:Icc-related predicted phosphoesterase